MLLDFQLESTIDDLFMMESLINLTKESCIKKELESVYYNLDKDMQLKLSNERNNYINLMSIAEEKILHLINKYTKLEYYNNTPTIAADK